MPEIESAPSYIHNQTNKLNFGQVSCDLVSEQYTPYAIAVSMSLSDHEPRVDIQLLRARREEGCGHRDRCPEFNSQYCHQSLIRHLAVQAAKRNARYHCNRICLEQVLLKYSLPYRNRTRSGGQRIVGHESDVVGSH